MVCTFFQHQAAQLGFNGGCGLGVLIAKRNGNVVIAFGQRDREKRKADHWCKDRSLGMAPDFAMQ